MEPPSSTTPAARNNSRALWFGCLGVGRATAPRTPGVPIGPRTEGRGAAGTASRAEPGPPSSGGPGQPTRVPAPQRSQRHFQARPGARGAQGEPLLELRGAGKSGGEGKAGRNSLFLRVWSVIGSAWGTGRRILKARSGRAGPGLSDPAALPAQAARRSSPSACGPQSGHRSSSWGRPSPQGGL